MTQIPLTIGCTLLGFGPYLSLFFFIVYKKAQLVIVATSAAFFFLLSSTGASLSWKLFDTIGLNGPLAAIIPGVFFQFIGRCAFVSLYHKVEHVIQLSLQKQQQQQQLQQNQQQQDDQDMDDPNSNTGRGTDQAVAIGGGLSTTNNDYHRSQPPILTSPSSSGGAAMTTTSSYRRGSSNYNGCTTSGTNHSNYATDASRFRLEVNDAASAIAAATGYGGLHAVLMYGTLLASQTQNVGILYQDSCPKIPTLILSGIFTFLFSVLDVFWMLFTFFGMRRRLLFHRGEENDVESDRNLGAWFGNTRTGGNTALLLVLISHFVASMMTVADYFPYGCTVSIPSVAGVLLITMYLFWAGCGRIYMPPISPGSNRPYPAVVNGHHLQSMHTRME